MPARDRVRYQRKLKGIRKIYTRQHTNKARTTPSPNAMGDSTSSLTATRKQKELRAARISMARLIVRRLGTSFVGEMGWDGRRCGYDALNWMEVGSLTLLGSGYVGPAVVRKPVDDTVRRKASNGYGRESQKQGKGVLFPFFWKNATVRVWQDSNSDGNTVTNDGAKINIKWRRRCSKKRRKS